MNIVNENLFLIKAVKNSPNKKGLEMSALIPGSNASSLKSEARPRVREYHLSNIRFLQELGEGAFGNLLLLAFYY